MITRIKWKNHNIVGDLELDFTKDEKPCNTIVIAGENGTGITTILESLYNFLYSYNKSYFDFIEFVECTIATNRFMFYKIVENGGDLIKCKNSNTGEEIDFNYEDKLDIRSYGVSYLKASLGLKTDLIQSITNKSLDNFFRGPIGDAGDRPTEIKQLLVDISSQDSFQFLELSRNEEINYESFEKKSKIYRFKNAVNSFF